MQDHSHKKKSDIPDELAPARVEALQAIEAILSDSGLQISTSSEIPESIDLKPSVSATQLHSNDRSPELHVKTIHEKPEGNRTSAIPPLFELQLALPRMGTWFPACQEDWRRFTSDVRAVFSDTSFEQCCQLAPHFVETLRSVVSYLYQIRLQSIVAEHSRGGLPPSSVPLAHTVSGIQRRLDRLEQTTTALRQSGKLDPDFSGLLNRVAAGAAVVVAGMLASIPGNEK